MHFVSDFFGQSDFPDSQFLIRILIFLIGVLVLFIVMHAVFDLAHYLAFRFKFRRSFVPRSWLFVATTSLWTLVVPARSQALDQSSSVISSDTETSEKTNYINQINSLLTCSVVVAGLLLEIGKLRGRHLAKLEAYSRLNHPSAGAMLTELSLRAVQNAQSLNQNDCAELLLPSNSGAPVYVPLGKSDTQQVFVDIGAGSVISITCSDKAEQSEVFTGLVVSALFAAKNRPRVIVYTRDSRQHVDFSSIATASSIAEVLCLAKSSNTHCVVFSSEVLLAEEISQLQANNIAIVCQNDLANATTRLHCVDSTWHLSPINLLINPFGLTGEQVATLSELLTDVVRCVDESTVSKEIVNSATVAIENINDYKVLVRTLGPVEVELADGRTIEFEKSKTKELLAWLTNHRSRPTRSAARTALWEFTVADATFTNVVSDIRRTLRQTELLSPLEEWIPRTFSDHLPFHHSIVSDGEVLNACIAKAQKLSPEDAVVELHRGLELVRDLPFSGTGYLWPDAEGITSQLVITVITAAIMAAELDLQRGKTEGVFWATAQGLKVLGAHEELFALRMKAHALQGDLAGVRFEFESYQRAIASDSFSIAEPSQKLVNLLDKLTNDLVVGKFVALAR
jgi:two-component SAPR family response regulator